MATDTVAKNTQAAAHRTAALWVPDWPVLAAMSAASIPAAQPVAVLSANRVVDASAAARATGVYRGMTKRAAQQVCPELLVLGTDPNRDARAFEVVAKAVETVVAGIEIVRPGLILLEPGGAARYHGSESALIAELVEVVAEVGFEAQGAVADGLLAPILLARDLMAADLMAGRQENNAVAETVDAAKSTVAETGAFANTTADPETTVALPAGGSSAYLARRPTSDLEAVCYDHATTVALGEMVSLWSRLGVHTLGDLAALPEPAVASRFGSLGQWAWSLAQGADLRPASKRRVETELIAEAELDPPALRVDIATFAARRLADQLYGLLTRQGLACGRLRITARTEEGSQERCWRMDEAAAGGLSPARITDRVRWQLEGWLTSAQTRLTRDEDGAPAPIVHLSLKAEDVFPAGTHQMSLWGAGAGGDDRARRALERVQGLLGADGVAVAELQGGRNPRERVHLATFGEHSEPERPLDRPWPGQLPEPAPATVLPEPALVQVYDGSGQPVRVRSRINALSNPPNRLQITTAEATHACAAGNYPVATWAGPWLAPTRWWLGEAQQAWLQILLQDGRGLLLCAELNDETAQPETGLNDAAPSPWRLAAVYD